MSTEQDQEFGKLRRLLALKRHERPPQGYFDNFLTEFHRRQRAQPIRRETWWAQVVEFFRGEPLLAARYALGTALVLLLGVNVYVLSQHGTLSPTSPTAVAEAFTPQQPPSVIAAKEGKAGAADRDALTTATQLASNVQYSSGPHYILDRVNLAPASYDPKGDF